MYTDSQLWKGKVRTPLLRKKKTIFERGWAFNADLKDHPNSCFQIMAFAGTARDETVKGVATMIFNKEDTAFQT